ncbi:ATP-binding protein [Vibrio sp. 10N.286.52.C3]|uniref:ATP-binding protein n=1 Tax=Vibrio TaxID=662 RepID=UPI0002E6D792|nr:MULTISPECIES: ATP-binding protein [Vibrio]ANP78991.1 two-component sensor histidine kinase [Vibrio crassostreae 9CS106]MCT4348140.1 ATP-binding protein [Vibrio sp. NC2]OEF27125.1 two-component sensor histidine kinase [Vibrio splendidus 1S-124]PMH05238.1 two-component sensor histidine kinase [Vibrio splendidus]PTQ20860.1 two-component sensor histidine kinase [Vibrio splendidus]
MLFVLTYFINSSFQRGLQDFTNNNEIALAQELANNLKQYYSPSEKWRRLEREPHLIASSIGGPSRPHPRDRHPSPPPLREPEAPGLQPIWQRLNILDQDGRAIIGPPENLHHLEDGQHQALVEITLDDQVIGYISIVQMDEISGPLAESFFKQQTTHVSTIASITVLLSFLISLFLVRRFLKPLRALSKGAKSIENGDLDFYIKKSGNDELSDLIGIFNGVVETLRKQKTLREQWLSDISHELRTPITVLRSELEALQDGIRSPEPKYIDSLHQQIITLGQLVEDLHQLSLYDIGFNLNVKNNVDIHKLIDSVIVQNSIRLEQKNITLTKHYDHSAPLFTSCDERLLTQLFVNLLENSARYTSDNGHVSIDVTDISDSIIINVEDSDPGVPDASLPRLFERLYRVDKSRSRSSGGSGLGLSICKNIVEAHQGHITADHSELGGLRIIIALPKEIKS